ncbi:MAG: hypothetical protein KGL39_39585 [Patescibacteria group bacterium]|nr:hypothetical protein [Patescibacteria group bacterium]
MIPARTFRRPAAAPKPILYPAGTQLADVPPLARGLTWIEYLDTQIAEWKKAPLPVPEAPQSVLTKRKR